MYPKKRIPYRDMPKCFIDIETTGLKFGFHETLEICLLHDHLDTLNLRIKPSLIERADPEALEICRYNEADWSGAVALEDVWPDICRYIDGAIIIGHNIVGFDVPFLRAEAASKMLRPPPFNERTMIDTQMLALAMLVPEGLNSLRLQSCCTHLGISNEVQHEAMADAVRTKQVFQRMFQKQLSLFGL